MIAMDRRAAVEQQNRSSVGGVGGKKRRVASRKGGVRLKRSNLQHVVSVEEQRQQQRGAIESLAYEIDTLVQEQEDVLGLLRRKKIGLFRGLGDRFKTAIRGTDGEHDLKELKQQLNWLRQKEAQLREEKLLLLIKDVSEQPNLQAPGAVDAAVDSASAAERAAKSTAAPSKTRFRFHHPTSNLGLSRPGIKAGSGEVAAIDNDKENREVAMESNVRLARHSFGRSSARGEVGPERRHSIGSQLSRGGLDAFRVDGDGRGSGGTGGGIAAPGNVDRVHISSFKQAHLMSGAGETYLAQNKGHQPQPQFQSSGSVSISGPIWRRPMFPNAHPATSAVYEAKPGGIACTAEEVTTAAVEAAAAAAAAAAVAAAAAAAAAAEAEASFRPPYTSGGDWKHEETPQPYARQDTAGDVDLAAAPLMSPGVPSETISPTRLMQARASEYWEKELGTKAVVMRRHTVVNRKQLPTVSHCRRNSSTWASVNGSTSTRSQPVTAAVAAPPSNTDTDTGRGLESGDEVQDAREVCFATKPGLMPVSPTMQATTAAAARGTSSPAAPARGESEKLAAAKTALLRGRSSGSFELPCEIDRLVPAAVERRRLSPVPAAAEQLLEPSDATTSPASEAETLDGMIERELELSVVVTVGGKGAGVGVETLSTLPPTVTKTLDDGVEPAKVVGARATKTWRPSYAERTPSETASSASVTTLAVDTTREISSSLAVTPTAFQSTAPAAVAPEAPVPAPVVRPPKPHHTHPGKHPLASMAYLLTSCFAFVDAADGNSSLPKQLRREMKRNAIAAARNAEVSKAVKMETPPSVWVTQYEDMSKKYGLGFLLSDGSSGVTFKDGTKMALDADGSVFEYVEGRKQGSSKKNSNETIDPSPYSETIGGEPSTTAAVTSAVERRRRIERIGYALDDYPSRYGKKVTIAQKVRELLQLVAGEEDSAAGSTKAVTPPAAKAILPDARGASGEGEGWGGGGGADDDDDIAAGGGGFGGTLVNPAKASRTSGEPLIFVEGWKRTRGNWIFRLSNRMLQVVFLDATEILLSEDARLITFIDKDGGQETLALLRALDEDRPDVITRVRECHALIKEVIRYDERRRQ